MTNRSGRPPRSRIGEVYNNLTVIADASCVDHKGRWLCRCSCGNEQVFSNKQLLNVKFCDGCRPIRRHDLSGKIFGHLTVLRLDTTRKITHWVCLCTCGKEKSVNATALKTGNTRSCGCFQRSKERKNQDNYLQNRHDVLLRSKIASYKANARTRGYEWSLTDAEAVHLMQSDCFYCKAPPSNIVSHEKLDQFVFYSGIDRVVNEVGYTKENVVPCCRDCNLAKRDRDVRSFLVWVHRVAKHTAEPDFDLSLEVCDHDVTRHPALNDVLALFDDERCGLPLNLANIGPLNGTSDE